MILVLSGTHEGRAIIEQLLDMNLPCTLSVTSSLGAQTYADLNCPIHLGKFDVESLTQWIHQYQVKGVIDATHPHAQEIKKIAQIACEHTKTPYFRFRRKPSQTSLNIPLDKVTYFNSVDDLISTLKQERQVRNILITGIKHIDVFYKHFSKEQCFFRIMPSRYSIEQCELKHVPLSNIIGIKAPCSVSLNQALLETYDISHFVFKESGEGSGYMNNLEAIKEQNVKSGVKGFILKEVNEDVNFRDNTYEHVKDMCLMIKKIML